MNRAIGIILDARNNLHYRIQKIDEYLNRRKVKKNCKEYKKT